MKDKVYVAVISLGGELELRFATQSWARAFKGVDPEAIGSHYIYIYTNGVISDHYCWFNDTGWTLMGHDGNVED